MHIMQDILAVKFEGTDSWLPILIALAISGGFIVLLRCFSNKSYPSYIKLATVLVGIGLVILEFNLLLHNWSILHLASGLLVGIPIAVCMWKCFSMQASLQRVKCLAEPNTLDFNIVAAWELLQSLSVKKMFPSLHCNIKCNTLKYVSK